MRNVCLPRLQKRQSRGQEELLAAGEGERERRGHSRGRAGREWQGSLRKSLRGGGRTSFIQQNLIASHQTLVGWVTHK